MYRQEYTVSFNSDPATGAVPVGSDGSIFHVDLNTALAFDPKTIVSVEAAVLQAAVWNTSPNVSPAFQNNAFRFTTSVAPAGTYDIVFPQGLFSLSGIGSYISTQLVNLGLPANLFLFSGEDATQKVVITILTAGDSIDFSVASSIGPLLGFSAAPGDNPVVAPIAGFNAFSQGTAALNRNNSYRIRSTLVSGGIQSNAISGGVIAKIPIDQSPGSQINYSPQNPLWFSANELIGVGKQSLDFFLENQSGQPTPTAGEFYDFVVAFRYYVRESR